MINYLKGTLVSKQETSPTGCNLTIEVNNIGYLVQTNRRVLSALPETGESAVVYTSLIHKEDTMYLCGFEAREDRDLFNLLQSVSGIGVKSALLMLDELGYEGLINSVISGDDKALSRAKGVGPKLAKRVILELKDKMTNWRDKLEVSQLESSSEIKADNRASYLEAESVILSLGYTRKEASDGLKHAISACSNPENSEDLLKYALQWLATH